MKKNLWIWAIAALSMAACTSEDAPTQEQIVTENDWESPDGRVVVQLSAEGLPTPTASVSRSETGTGIIENTNIDQLNNLGIFALNRRSEEYDYTNNQGELTSDNGEIKADNDVLLNNVMAMGTNNNTLDPEVHKGVNRIRLYHDPSNTETASIYYYPIQPKEDYNFYGYFPRQDDPKKVKYTENGVTVEFDKIEGDVDIITGQSVGATPIGANTLYTNLNDITEKSHTALTGYNSKYIRTIKYHNWIIDEKNLDETEKKEFVPNIQFKHQTTLLEFYVIANEKQAGEDQDNDKDNSDEPYIDQYNTTLLRVFDVKLVNENKIAKWNVITDEISWSPAAYENGDPDTDIKMIKDSGSNIWELTKIDETDTDVIKPSNLQELQKKEDTPRAGYLMVQPKNSYQVKLSILAPTGNGSAFPPTQETTLDIKNIVKKEGGENEDRGFRAGFRYKIYIKLNALQEVNIHAVLEDWETGESIDIPVE